MFLKGEEKMYSLRSKLLSIVSLGTILMMLVGCAAPAQNPTAAPAATQAQPTAAPAATQAQAVVTLKYHTWYPPESALRPILDQFEKENPNIKVELTVEESTKYQQSLPLALNSGEAIDVVGVQSGLMVEQIRANLQPIDQLMAKYAGSDWESKFVAGNLKTARSQASDGGLYFIPLGRLGSAVGFYNGAIFDELGLKVPQTYAELVAAAKTIRAKKPDVIPMVFPGDNWFQDELVLTIVGQDDPSFFNNIRYKDGKWDTASYIQALTEYKQMYKDNVLSLDNQDIKYDQASKLFYTGKAAMYFNGTWEAGLLSAPFRQTNKIDLTDVGLMALPTFTATGTQSLRSFIEVGLGVPVASTHPAEAIKLIQYLLEGPGLTSLMTNFIVVPSKAGYAVDSSLLTTQRAKDGYTLLEKLINNPAGDRNNMSALSAQIGNELQAMITKDVSPEDTAKTIQADYASGRYK
jgi:raffinose/stachyose/melibiose transport system substrate-binding protein